MTSEEFEKLKERVQQLKQETDEVLSLRSYLKKLEETEKVREYLELLDLYEEKNKVEIINILENIKFDEEKQKSLNN